MRSNVAGEFRHALVHDVTVFFMPPIPTYRIYSYATPWGLYTKWDKGSNLSPRGPINEMY